jgi:hypothetical protein
MLAEAFFLPCRATERSGLELSIGGFPSVVQLVRGELRNYSLHSQVSMRDLLPSPSRVA